MRLLDVVILISAVFAGAVTTVSCDAEREPESDRKVQIHNKSEVLKAAELVIEALEAKDGEKLSELAHPNHGVRFSPYAYVDVEGDRVLTRAEIARFWDDRETYLWGYADGTGDPIELSPSKYYDRYVMDRDFSNPSSINYNDDQAAGNTTNNAAAVYTKGSRVEYYLLPDPGRGDPAFDWAALRLVFEESDGSWYLIAVIHDEWTT